IQMVEAKATHLADARREQAMATAQTKGVKLTEASLKSIERKATQPIAEMRQPHVLVRRVSDDAGFSCQVLATEETELELPAPVDRLNDARAARTVTVDRVPGLVVRDSGDREYPFETLIVSVDRSTFPGAVRSDTPIDVTVSGIGSHIIGRMRDRIYGSAEAEDSPTGKAFVGDPERREQFLSSNPAARADAYALLGVDRGSYRDGDRVGDGGVELTQENLLRGLRGVQTNRLDTGERLIEPPVRGQDVHLTLDVMLQARVQALMTPAAGLAVVQPWHHQESTTQPLGAALYGAAVVLDIDTGDILAMVSTPSYTQEDLREHREQLLADKVAMPLLNRATQKYYTPGSIVKPLMLCGAVQRHVYSLDERIACTGHLFENQPNIFRCWIYKKYQTTHTALYGHALSPDEAIMCSCNVFFFTLGRRLGPEGVIDTYREFGVGDTFDLGAGYEVPGALGFKKDDTLLGIKLPDAIQMGIGQGPVTWTPLHAANAYATLARRGISQNPRLISGRARPEPRDLGLDPSAVDIAIHGLERSANEHEGTGNHISVDGAEEPIFTNKNVDVWGKTGTAAAPNIYNDPDGKDGPAPPELLEEGDHSWFVVMVGHGAPKYIISCVIDYGGSGGKVSGPIINQIIHAMELEGYL
ncbi:MAG: penicillin-binding transpeptidase domain-containing protein, partial [Phycisphaerales bacterium]